MINGIYYIYLYTVHYILFYVFCIILYIILHDIIYISPIYIYKIERGEIKKNCKKKNYMPSNAI